MQSTVGEYVFITTGNTERKEKNRRQVIEKLRAPW